MNNLKKILLVVLTSSILEPYSVQASTAAPNCTKMVRPFIGVNLRGGKNNIRGQANSKKLFAKYKKSLSEVLKNSANITVGKTNVTGNEKIELGSFVNDTQGDLKIDNTKEGQEAKKTLKEMKDDEDFKIGSDEFFKISPLNLKLASGNTQAEQNFSDDGLNIVVKNTVNVVEDNPETTYTAKQTTKSVKYMMDEAEIRNILNLDNSLRALNALMPNVSANNNQLVLINGVTQDNVYNVLTRVHGDIQDLINSGAVDQVIKFLNCQLNNFRKYSLPLKAYAFNDSVAQEFQTDYTNNGYRLFLESQGNTNTYKVSAKDNNDVVAKTYKVNGNDYVINDISPEQVEAYNIIGTMGAVTKSFNKLMPYSQIGIGLKGSTQDSFAPPASNLSNTISITDNGNYNLYAAPTAEADLLSNMSSNQMLGDLSIDLGARIYLGSKAFILPTVNFYIPMIGKELLMTAEGNTKVKKGETTNDKGISIKRNFGFGGTLGVGIDINEFVALYAALGAETSGLEGSEKLYADGYNSSFKLKGWNLISEFGTIFNISHFAVTAALQYRGGIKDLKNTETKGKNGSDSIYDFDQTSGIGFKFGISCIF